jgi:hypothetical protein
MDYSRQNIRYLMGERSINQLAELAEIGQTWLQRYLNPDKPSGIQKANPEKLGAVAQALGVSLNDLMFVDLSSVKTPSPSQLAQPDPEILAAAIKLVRLTFEALETEHDQEADGVPTALAYAYLQKRQQRVVTGENVVDFMKALRARSKGESGDGQGIGSAGGSHRAKGAATR